MVRGNDGEATAIEVTVGDGAIRVERTAAGLLLASSTGWHQRLTLAEGWRLAEAIDEVATGDTGSA